MNYEKIVVGVFHSIFLGVTSFMLILLFYVIWDASFVDIASLEKPQFFFVLIKVALIWVAGYLLLPWFLEEEYYVPGRLDKVLAIGCCLMFATMCVRSGGYFFIRGLFNWKAESSRQESLCLLSVPPAVFGKFKSCDDGKYFRDSLGRGWEFKEKIPHELSYWNVFDLSGKKISKVDVSGKLLFGIAL